ncbi:hypothetical protein Golob_025839 [Gossypium lobatum]|uniref:DNA-directed RNA polymerase III subunit RPC6 n=1 Tax=Gossypium lobatum TaxID=34289 RepID=A0A7J8LTA6_9ROSI|nr:hypothetical protein [Gossypium lobatum]
MNAKRKRPDTGSDSVTEQERIVHEVIRSKQDMGISQLDMKREINLHSNLIAKCIKSLVSKNLIKEVKNIHSRRQKHYMSAEFEPSNEITGGAWYVEGSLDKEYINVLKEQCWRKIYGLKVATLEGIVDAIKRSNVSQIELSKQQVEEIVKALVLDNEVMEVRSTGTGEFASIPVGKACYKCAGKRGYGGEPKLGALASVPCGVCPQISRCTPDGIISPITCEYYKKCFGKVETSENEWDNLPLPVGHDTDVLCIEQTRLVKYSRHVTRKQQKLDFVLLTEIVIEKMMRAVIFFTSL